MLWKLNTSVLLKPVWRKDSIRVWASVESDGHITMELGKNGANLDRGLNNNSASDWCIISPFSISARISVHFCHVTQLWREPPLSDIGAGGLWWWVWSLGHCIVVFILPSFLFLPLSFTVLACSAVLSFFETKGECFFILLPWQTSTIRSLFLQKEQFNCPEACSTRKLRRLSFFFFSKAQHIVHQY